MCCLQWYARERVGRQCTRSKPFGYWIDHKFYTHFLYARSFSPFKLGIWTSHNALEPKQIQWNMVNSWLLRCTLWLIFLGVFFQTTSIFIVLHTLLLRSNHMINEHRKFPFHERKHTMTIFVSFLFSCIYSRCFQLFIFRKSNRYASVKSIEFKWKMRMGWNVNFDKI